MQGASLSWSPWKMYWRRCWFNLNVRYKILFCRCRIYHQINWYWDGSRFRDSTIHVKYKWELINFQIASVYRKIFESRRGKTNRLYDKSPCKQRIDGEIINEKCRNNCLKKSNWNLYIEAGDKKAISEKDRGQSVIYSESE